jgi:hypothetical protein
MEEKATYKWKNYSCKILYSTGLWVLEEEKEELRVCK